MQDVIVIGGSYAGMAAALQLARARRNVLVIDAGEPRNRFASSSYGFLGQDGFDPAVIAATARRQLLAYPTLTWIDGFASEASGAIDGFRVGLTTGESFEARRLLIATGVADRLPAVPGLAERWGVSVFHCGYCHGYELQEGEIGVIGSSPMSLHQAQLLAEWGPTTLLANSAVELDALDVAELLARRVSVETKPIIRIEGEAEVVLADGRKLSFAGIFTTTTVRPASPIAEALGCAITDTLMGLQIGVDDAKETSIPGVFACGDVARTPHSVTLAVGDGAWAGVQVHRSLIWPPEPAETIESEPAPEEGGDVLESEEAL